MRKLVALLVLVAVSSTEAQEYQFSLSDVSVDPLAHEVTVEVSLSYSGPGSGEVAGASFGVSHGTADLEVSNLDLLVPAQFVVLSPVPGGWTLGVIHRGHGGQNLTLPSGEELPYVRVTYTFDPMPRGSVIALQFVDGLGVPPVELTLIDPNSVPLPVIAANGSITIGNNFVRGDANNDGEVTLTDVFWLQDHFFLGGPAAPCAEAMDIDGNGSLSLADIIITASHLVIDGAPPASPFPECGSAQHYFGCLDSLCP